MKAKFHKCMMSNVKYIFPEMRTYKNRIVRICMVCIFIIITGNSCNLVNDDTEESLTSYYFDEQTDREFYFYGDDTHLGSAIIKRQSSSDTLLCYLYDEQLRVKTIYWIINGKEGKALINFDYNDSAVIASTYSVDFESGDSQFENISAITKKQLEESIPDIMKDFPMGKKLKSAQDDDCIKFSAFAVTSTVLDIILITTDVYGGGDAVSSSVVNVFAGLGSRIGCIPSINRIVFSSELNLPANPLIRWDKMFPDKDVLVDTEWMLFLPHGGIQALSFQKDGICLNIDDFEGTFSVFGRNVTFTQRVYSRIILDSLFLPGVNYFIGTIREDGKGMDGTIYNLEFKYSTAFSAVLL